jgi:hypothetical protein
LFGRDEDLMAVVVVKVVVEVGGDREEGDREETEDDSATKTFLS